VLDRDEDLHRGATRGRAAVRSESGTWPSVSHYAGSGRRRTPERRAGVWWDIRSRTPVRRMRNQRSGR
jgi:hypothetical protein